MQRCCFVGWSCKYGWSRCTVWTWMSTKNWGFHIVPSVPSTKWVNHPFSAREWTFDICSLELIICPGCSRRMTMFSLINRLSITLSKLLTRYAVCYLLECWLYSFWCAFRWACFIFHLNPWLQLHPGALYLLGAVYLTGDCVKRDIASAMWCFHRASEKVSDFSLRISSMKYELDAQVSVSFIYT